MKVPQKILSAVFMASLVLTGIVVVPGLTESAQAQILSVKARVDQAKAQGLVGEQLDGYIGFVTPGVSADIRAAVNEINIKRKTIYTGTARAKKVSVSIIAGLTGEKLTAKARPGHMVKLGDGIWRPVG